MLTDFGGFFMGIIRFVALFGNLMNERLFLGKLISDMYMVKLGEKQTDDKAVRRKSK